MSMWKCIARARSPAWIAGVLSFLSLFPLAAPATAGQGAAAPASIIGQVTDATGAVLPGVTVTGTSPALQVPQVLTVTDERGDYRLTPLPIGVYAVTYELAGFQSLRRQNVRLTVGFAARVDVVLNLGAVAETITVSGASPLVDTTSTATRTEVTRDQLEVLPTTRDGLKAFLGQVPGVLTNFEVGASGLTDAVQFNVYGQVGESWQMLEGVMASAPLTPGRAGSHIDFNSIDGTRVQTVGSNAEMPRRGILMDAVVKSGGNDFHGSGTVYGSSGALEGSNVDDAQRRLGVIGAAKLHTVRDFAGNLGGRIVRNKLWFFGAARYEALDRDVLDVRFPDGSPVAVNSSMDYHVEKLSYQMTPGNRLTGFFNRDVDFQRRGANRFVPVDSREEHIGTAYIGKVEWQAVRSSSLVISLQSGAFQYQQHYEGVTHDQVATIDIATQDVTGTAISDGRENNMFRRHTKGAVSWYRPGLFAGNHDFKAGFDYLFSGYNPTSSSRASGNYQLQFNNGAPFEVASWNYPVFPENNAKYLGLYGQDAWTIARRLTLNVGIRYARDNAYAPAQCREAGDFAPAECWEKIQMRVFNDLAPRLHAAFDVSGNGRTVIKGGWGRFIHLREISPEVTATNRNVPTTTTWTWHDLNRNRSYDPGEVNLDPNGSDFRSIAGSTDAVPNPNEKPPKADEFSVTLERQVMANWAVRVSGVYVRNFDVQRLVETQRPYEVYNIPITNPDPGPDGRVGTADDPGTFITYYDYPASLAGRRFAGTMLINDPRSTYRYKTIEVATTKRLSAGWQFMASFTATKQNIPFRTSGTTINVITPLAFNPNAEMFLSDNTWQWQGKMSGGYELPLGIITSANFEHRNGAPQARQVLFTGGQQIRSIVLNVEPISSLRLPSTNLLDFRVGKRFSLGGERNLELRADIFNATNINTVTSRNLRAGSTFLVPSQLQQGSAIVLPRILQLGVTYTF